MFVFMESERLWYRTIEVVDAPIIGRWINDWTVRKPLLTPTFPLGLELEREYARSGSAMGPGKVRTEMRLLFGVKGKPLDKPVGSTGLTGVNWITADTEWGIHIGEPAHWGKGYGREVLARFLRYAFVGLNLNRVHLRVNAGNAAGIKAYSAAGFKQEALSRQATQARDGIDDQIYMSVLRDEWRKKRK